MCPPLETALGLVPETAGIGLKAQHYNEILEDQPPLGWFEVHTENYMGEGGAPHFYLEKIRRDYPLSLHGVGLSLGTDGELDKDHLNKIKKVVDRYQPGLVSEHISWSIQENHYLNDLLPLPYTEESLKIVCDHIDQMQAHLRRQILVENPSTYLQFKMSNMEEPEFLNEVTSRTGCGLLLDVNNIYVSCENHGWHAKDYIKKIRPSSVGEYHLAGHAIKKVKGRTLRIDDHGSNISRDVWALFEYSLDHIGIRPSLIEWDSNIPSLMTLKQEAERAETCLDKFRPRYEAGGINREKIT